MPVQENNTEIVQNQTSKTELPEMTDNSDSLNSQINITADVEEITNEDPYAVTATDEKEQQTLFPWWIVGVAGAVIIAAGAAILIVLKKKKA